MSLGLEELKTTYNKTLIREKKAEEFLNQASKEQYQRWLVEFTKIIVQLSEMIRQYKDLSGIEMTKEEATEGFNVSSK